MAESLFVIECPSGTNWLVEAESAEAALADWPEDAELAQRAREPEDREEAEWLVAQGQSDLHLDADAVADYCAD